MLASVEAARAATIVRMIDRLEALLPRSYPRFLLFVFAVVLVLGLPFVFGPDSLKGISPTPARLRTRALRSPRPRQVV